MEKASEIAKIDPAKDAELLIQAALDDLKNDPLVREAIKDLNLTTRQARENLPVLLSLQEDLHICAKCPGLDNCPKGARQTSIKLELVPGQGIVMQRAVCKPAMENRKLAASYLRRDFPESFAAAKLKELDVSANRNPLIKSLFLLIRNGFGPWPYISGKHKMGKTYMLVAFANDYIDNRHEKVAFANTPNLLEQLKEWSLNNKKQFKDTMDSLENAPLLILDNFGNENPTQYVFNNILYPLLLSRAQENLPTAFASDFSIEDIASIYEHGAGKTKANQLLELLKENCKEFGLKGVQVYK